MDQFLKLSDVREYKHVCQQMDAYINTMQTCFGKKPAPVDGEEPEEVEEPPAVGHVPDLLADSKIY